MHIYKCIYKCIFLHACIIIYHMLPYHTIALHYIGIRILHTFGFVTVRWHLQYLWLRLSWFASRSKCFPMFRQIFLKWGQLSCSQSSVAGFDIPFAIIYPGFRNPLCHHLPISCSLRFYASIFIKQHEVLASLNLVGWNMGVEPHFGLQGLSQWQ